MIKFLQSYRFKEEKNELVNELQYKGTSDKIHLIQLEGNYFDAKINVPGCTLCLHKTSRKC